MVAPTLTLWLYMIAFGVACGMSSDGTMSWRADYVAQVALSLILASWVTADAQKRQLKLCHDFDSFVFFAWPIVLPVYLFRTRGVRAFLTLLCFAGIWLVAMLAAMVVFMIRAFVFL